MTFDYENAIQQGLNVDTTTNDKNVEAKSLEIALDSNDGTGEFRILDSDNSAVVVANSDGYLSIAGKLEVHGLNQTNTGYIKLQDSTGESSIFLLDGNPDGVVSGTKASLGLDYTDGYAYINRDGSTYWDRLATASEVGSTTTLQSAYKNDTDGANATITTDSTDGSVVIAGTESLQVNAAGGIVLTTGFTQTGTNTFDVNLTGAAFSLDASGSPSNVTVDGANLTVSTTTSGNLNLQSAGVSTLQGTSGVVLDGNGSNVIPATDNTDSLGSLTNGFTTAYVRNIADTATVGLKDAGGVSVPNTTSGAASIGTNSTNFPTFGSSMAEDSVQAALEAIDGYLSTTNNSTFTQKRGLELNGAILNGVVNITHINDTPALQYASSMNSRARWTMSMPGDWDRNSDFDFEVLWSPSDASAGDVVWRLEYKVLNIGDLSNTAATTTDYTQASAGTAYVVESTTNNLVIPVANLDVNNAIIVANIVRVGDDAGDTYSGNALVHLITVNYQAKNIA